MYPYLTFLTESKNPTVTPVPPNLRGHVMERNSEKEAKDFKIKYPHFVIFTKAYNYVNMALERPWVNKSPKV